MVTLRSSRILPIALILDLALAGLSGSVVQSAVLTAQPCQTAPFYVDGSHPNGGDGLSWNSAFNDLQTAIDAASAAYFSSNYECQWVWVAHGTYKPSVNDRAVSFQLKDGAWLFGGFAGTETDFAQRNWKANLTLLSGDLNGDDGPYFSHRTDNSYNVVVANNLQSGSGLLDGFTISGGYANVGMETSEGGGIYISGGSAVQLDNLTITDNYSKNEGGGIFLYNSMGTLSNLSITGNYTLTYGGGMVNAVARTSLVNVIFSGNIANQGGGGLECEEDSPQLTNVLFTGNMANNGAGMYTRGSSHPTLTNVTFSGNLAWTSGGGMYNDGSWPTIQNSILWGDQYNVDRKAPLGANDIGEEIFNVNNAIPVISYSLVFGCNPQGVWDSNCGTDNGNNVPDADPLFVYAANGNLHLQAGSPAIDVGNNDLVSGITTDLDGNPRINGNAVDLGAYEYKVSNQVNLYLPVVYRAK